MTACMHIVAMRTDTPAAAGWYVVATEIDEHGSDVLRVCRWHDGAWWPMDSQPDRIDHVVAWWGPFLTLPHPEPS